MLATIEWGKIGELLYIAPLAGLAVAITFSVLIAGVARAQDARRSGAGTMAAVQTVVALVAGAAFVAVVVFGIHEIVSK
jgi:hypothetical protein